MKTILENLTAIGFMISIIFLFISLFIDFLPFVKRLLPVDPKIVMCFSIIGAVLFSYQMGRNSYSNKIEVATAKIQGQVDVSEVKSENSNVKITSDVKEKTTDIKEVIRIQKVEIEKSPINQECKIDKNIINTLNKAAE